ncbi:MAG: hypothetical protein ACI9GM_000092 [Salibacteraceae bacterium]|jgi:hypothetical protein
MFISVSSNLFSQNVGVDYNLTGSGRNITATISKEFEKCEIGVGVGYNINSLTQSDDQNQMYYQRLFATKPIQHLNVELFYNFFIFKNFKHIKPFLFVDVQAKYSTTRSSMYLPYAIDSTISGSWEDQILYINVVENFGPFLWIENYIGVGFNVEMVNNLFLKERIGFGGYSVIGTDDRLCCNYRWEFAGMFSTGIFYHF